MSISYHGIVGYGSGRVTLPSVETWSTNMNLLRDPPKSVFTRKKDRVGQTSAITEMIDGSGDRACEAILTYARGVNPMVAVSYDNYGNNGGQKSGNLSQAGLNIGGGRKSAYLPYRIMDKGAFRPPIRDQRDLLPLSRLPRIWTSSFTQPGFADFSKKTVCQSDTGDEYRAIKSEDQILRSCVRPTATYKIETPIVENYEVKYVIKNPVQVSAFSGIQPQARYNGELGEPVAQIHQEILHPDVRVNSSGEYSKDVDTSNFSTEKYTHDVLHGEYQANVSRNVGTTSIEDLYGVDTKNRTKNVFVTDYTAPQSGYEKYEYIHSDIELDKVMPYHEGRTNTGLNIHKRMEGQKTEREYMVNRPMPDVATNIGGSHLQAVDMITSRSVNLKPTVRGGGFDPIPTIPTYERENQLQEFDIEKSRMRKSVYEMQQDRSLALGNIPFSAQETFA
jgi:hypothetical protein